MAKTRKPIVRGLITEARLADLQPGMVLRLHIPAAADGKWNWHDVRFIERDGNALRCADRFGDSAGVKLRLNSIGIRALSSGRFAATYITIRDEELGLRSYAD